MRLRLRRRLGQAMVLGAAAMAASAPVHALEHLTLRNGATWDCVRHEIAGDRARVYTSESNYIEIRAAEIVSVEMLPDPVAVVAPVQRVSVQMASTQPTRAELSEMLNVAGRQHNVDADLLASIVQAESGGHVHAVSPAGAQGLMQLMPGTARELGVSNSFVAEQNIAGGSQYFDSLLTRYHDNIALAAAAYNAGPGAVDRYHGVPPYRETRAYVARVIREFNRRKSAAMASAKLALVASAK